MSRALLLVDIDGVCNPCDAKPHRRPEGYLTHRLRPAGFEHARKPLRVWLNPDHGPLLLAFAAEHDVELAWCTTWEHDANRLIGPRIGLPELPVVEFGEHPGRLPGWKYPAVLDFAAGRPLAWLDDDFRAVEAGLIGRARVRARAEFLAARAGVPTVLHHVDPRVGLRASDLDVVARELNACTIA